MKALLIALLVAQVTVPYSCRLLYDEQRKQAYGDTSNRQTIERLRNECLRDGGRP